MNLRTKQRLRERTYGCWHEGIVRLFGEVTYTLIYTKWKMKKELYTVMQLYSMLRVVRGGGWEWGGGENECM